MIEMRFSSTFEGATLILDFAFVLLLFVTKVAYSRGYLL